MGHFLIVGGNSGIGAELSKRLLNQQNQVTILSRQERPIEGAQFMLCDVTQNQFPDLQDPLQGLVYCPGTINLKPLRQLSDEDLKHDFEVNCLGAFKVIKHYLPLLESEAKASIVLFSTVAVQRGMAFHTSIAAAKGAVEGMTRSLAAELAPKIRINCIAPSLTQTPLSESLMKSKDVLEKRHPLKRLGTVEDMASMAQFLLSEESGWITGQVMGIDGGLSTLSAF